MARYIDADELKKQVDLVQVLVMGGRCQGKTLLNETMEIYKKGIFKKIDEQPTADVAPKSEVELLQAENERLTIKMNAYGLTAKRLKEDVERLQEELTKAEADVRNYMKVAEYQQSLSVKRYHEIKQLKEDVERLQDINNRQVEDVRLAKQEVARRYLRRLRKLTMSVFGLT